MYRRTNVYILFFFTGNRHYGESQDKRGQCGLSWRMWLFSMVNVRADDYCAYRDWREPFRGF